MVEVHRAMRLARPDGQLLSAREDALARLRTLDAIHLATALRARVRRVVTYDRRLAEAARELGLDVLRPA